MNSKQTAELLAKAEAEYSAETARVVGKDCFGRWQRTQNRALRLLAADIKHYRTRLTKELAEEAAAKAKAESEEIDEVLAAEVAAAFAAFAAKAGVANPFAH